jgi:hypothetical protein
VFAGAWIDEDAADGEVGNAAADAFAAYGQIWPDSADRIMRACAQPTRLALASARARAEAEANAGRASVR